MQMMEWKKQWTMEVVTHKYEKLEIKFTIVKRRSFNESA